MVAFSRQAPYCHPTCAHTRRHSTGVKIDGVGGGTRHGSGSLVRDHNYADFTMYCFSCLSHLSMHTRVYSLSM